jgi:hypothetical protein
LPPLSRFKIPQYRYFPTHLMESEGPKHWAQLRLLQACERINIPQQLWPKFSELRLPHEYGFRYAVGETLVIPSFNPLYESEAEWRDRAHGFLDKFLDKYAVMFRERFRQELDEGRLTKIKPVRDTTPLNLRYEWAARRHCLREPYRTIASSGYTEARVKQAVLKILRKTGLKK